MIRARTLVAIAKAEAVQLIRTRVALTLLVIVPIAQVVLFGLAVRPDPVVTVALAAPASAAADEVVRRLRVEPGLRVGPTGTPGSAEAAVRRGDAVIGIEVPRTPSLADPFASRRPVRIVADASNAALVATALARIDARYWQARAERAEDGTGPLPLEIERLHNPQLRTDWSFLTGLTGVVVMIASLMLGALSLAREREGGSWETLLTLPVHRVEIVFGKLLPYLLLGTLQGIAVTAVAALGFGVPMRGGVGALLLVIALSAAAHFAIGYAIAARAATQLAALQGAVAFYLPAMLLSGFLYPFEGLPGWARAIGQLLPLTHVVSAARAAMLKGADDMAVLAFLSPIALALVVALALGVALQNRRLD